MSRVKITVPDGPSLYTAQITLRVTDLNYGAQMGNEVALVVAHEARVQWLQSLGYTEMRCGGAALIMADAAVVYKAEGLAGDRLDVELFAEDVSARSFNLIYRAACDRSGGRTEIFLAKTALLAFDYAAKKLPRFDPVFLAVLG